MNNEIKVESAAIKLKNGQTISQSFKSKRFQRNLPIMANIIQIIHLLTPKHHYWIIKQENAEYNSNYDREQIPRKLINRIGTKTDDNRSKTQKTDQKTTVETDAKQMQQ